MLPPLRIDSRYRFNPKLGTTGRYIDARGRMVKNEAVIAEMENVLSGVKGEMIGLSQQLQNSEIGLQEWYNGMRSRMKVIHGIEAAIAKGGWAQMTQSDWGAVGAITKQQYRFLNNFAAQIEDGLPLDGRFLLRTGMYADAARATGEDMKRREADRNGFDEEARVLAPADHCVDCVRWSVDNLGWQPIGTIPRIGESICRTNCHCRFIFRRRGDNARPN
jgi:hypothetical protein